uniref:Protein kinase domain-containing protein n=1 Tax=Steinernema glaseri TaxID=37863 RepID=A0A1I8AI39_9BILA
MRRESECGSDIFGQSYEYISPINKKNRSKSSSSLLKNTVRLRSNHRQNTSTIEADDLTSEIESCAQAPPPKASVQHLNRSEFALPMCEFDTSAVGRPYELATLDDLRGVHPNMNQSCFADLAGEDPYSAATRRASYNYVPNIETQQVYQPHQFAKKVSSRVASFEASGVSSNEEGSATSSADANQPVRVKVRPSQSNMARSMSSIGPSFSRNYYGASTPGLNNVGEPFSDVMAHTETSNSSTTTTPINHFSSSMNGAMRNSPSFQQQMKRQQMKLNLSTPNTPSDEHTSQGLPNYTSSRRSSALIDYNRSETHDMNAMLNNVTTSTPNKMAVAPLQKPRRSERDDREYSMPHGYKSSHHHRSHNDRRVMPLRSPYQCANSPSSSGSSARSPSVGARVGSPLSTPVAIDLPPSSCASNQELSDRVRFLEQVIASGGVVSPDVSTSMMFAAGSSHTPGAASNRIHRTAQLVVSTTPSLSPYALAQQQIMARDVVDKEYQIETLKKQLEVLNKQAETRQIQYEEDVNAFKKESEEARSQLVALKSKVEDLETESTVYQQKLARSDQSRQVAIVESQEKILSQEKELSTLRQELAKKEELANDYEQMKKERDWLDKQNASLSQQLDETDAIRKKNELLNELLREKETQVKELEDTIIALEMKANMSLSTSKSAHGFFYDDDDEDSIDRLLPSGSETPLSSTFDLTSPGIHRVAKSASTHQFGADNGSSVANRLISKQMTQMFTALLRKSNDCKTLARCLADTASTALEGKEPNFNRLLGCYSDVSESDSEPIMRGSVSTPTNMTTAVAERYLRKNNEDLARVEQLLETLRSKFITYYQQRCEGMQCQVQ